LKFLHAITTFFKIVFVEFQSTHIFFTSSKKQKPNYEKKEIVEKQPFSLLKST